MSKQPKDMLDAINIFETFFSETRPSPGLRIKSGRISIGYSGELDLRRKLAVIARSYGWLVEEEVVVPGWGRIDLVLRDRKLGHPRLIELKLDLTKPAAIRRAFQQADGYGRWWAMHRNEPNSTTVVGATMDSNAVAAVHAAYPEVGYCDGGSLINRLGTWGDPNDRADRASERAAALQELLAVHEHAVKDLQMLVGLTDTAAPDLSPIEPTKADT